MYSSGNPTNIANPVKDASVQIDIKTASGRLTLYQTTLCEKIPWDKFNDDIDLDPQSFWDTYNENDIQLICCQADASILWLVPSVVQTRFIQSLDWDTDMDIIFTWVLTRDRPKGKEVVKYERTIDPVDLPMRSDVQKVLNGSMNSFRIYNVYPRYFRVTGSGDVRPLEQEVCYTLTRFFSSFLVSLSFSVCVCALNGSWCHVMLNSVYSIHCIYHIYCYFIMKSTKIQLSYRKFLSMRILL